MSKQKLNQNKNQNTLASYRRRMGLSQRRVAYLLGHKSHGALSDYENGHTLPTLLTALKLEIVLRTPVAFLFPGLYESHRDRIRTKEEPTSGSGQQDLFDNSPRRL